MENSLNVLQDTVRALLPSGGTAETGFSGLTACRFTDRTVPMPKTTNPYLYLVLDGTLRLYTPSGIMDYAPGQYSVSQIDTPLSGTVLSFSEHEDFLALVLEFSVSDVIAWVLELDNDLVERITGDRLTEATRLMLDEGRNVTGASLEVGYESLSQFIRDYKKMFGLAPKEDILRLRRQWKE